MASLFLIKEKKMKCRIENGTLIVDAESCSETEELKAWRAEWRKEPVNKKWFVCNYYQAKSIK